MNTRSSESTVFFIQKLSTRGGSYGNSMPSSRPSRCGTSAPWPAPAACARPRPGSVCVLPSEVTVSGMTSSPETGWTEACCAAGAGALLGRLRRAGGEQQQQGQQQAAHRHQPSSSSHSAAHSSAAASLAASTISRALSSGWPARSIAAICFSRRCAVERLAPERAEAALARQRQRGAALAPPRPGAPRRESSSAMPASRSAWPPAAGRSRAAAGCRSWPGQRPRRRHSRARRSGRPAPARSGSRSPSQPRSRSLRRGSARAWPRWWRSARHRPAPARQPRRVERLRLAPARCAPRSLVDRWPSAIFVPQSLPNGKVCRGAVRYSCAPRRVGKRRKSVQMTGLPLRR